MLTTAGVSSTQEKIVHVIEFKWESEYHKVEARTEKEEEVIKLLHDGAKTGNLQVVRSLVKDSKVNPNSRDGKGWAAIVRAAKANHVEIVEFLIHEKADLNSSTKQGNTAMHKAAKRHRTEIASMLIAARADFNVANKGGATPLMMAAMHRHGVGVLEKLLEVQADVNAHKDVGYTALMLAARQGNGRGVAALLQAKAHLEVADKRRETALAKARKYNHDEVAKILVQSGALCRGNHQNSSSNDTKSAGKTTGEASSSGSRRK
mmetsp:Transcript_68319/g.209539  ORF Transcript_68319/g.209539 Transcript_68319/m.209539 type:complete len:263 (-) Transcript_68319:73-861(-)